MNVSQLLSHQLEEAAATLVRPGLPNATPTPYDSRPRYVECASRPNRGTRDLELELVTPLYGGGARAGERAPQFDPVRASSIRGQLRFWWRARNGDRYASRDALWAAERMLWGGSGESASDVQRSSVTLSVTNIGAGTYSLDSSDVGRRHVDAYVLWPAGMSGSGVARVASGLTFTLRVSWRTAGKNPNGASADSSLSEVAVKAALRDWILFGGVGGRTRRGCGSLSVVSQDDREWLGLPRSANELNAFGKPLVPAVAQNAAQYICRLSGAEYRASAPLGSLDAWRCAYGWLRDFRQGTTRGTSDSTTNDAGQRTCGDYARSDPGHGQRGAAGRAGQSRWPEADKIRRLEGESIAQCAHPPHYGEQPAWPRANFGLPIQIRWQM